jgi:chorismate dehydratase
VKLHFRVPPREVRRLALDEGSRTSAALSQILLAELCDVRPQLESLPIGHGPETTDADAVLLIGDRAITNQYSSSATGISSPPHSALHTPHSAPPSFLESWDLGERWLQWTGLPFVFAMWIARADADTTELAPLLSAARDQGVERIDEIAAREAPLIGITEQIAASYLRDNLHFTIADDEARAVRRFYDLCIKHNLAPAGNPIRLAATRSGARFPTSTSKLK